MPFSSDFVISGGAWIHIQARARIAGCFSAVGCNSVAFVFFAGAISSISAPVVYVVRTVKARPHIMSNRESL